ncbi:MlaD family protein [Mycobacterium sp. CVI_P3]|uniref:MlaD family protein n=1 Tax=Mycobacterium pinniadriaticum TaxID=2994102 RepID=A0ABT3SC50_9MYCO|nr:MlaD family protein [Mycobacterium pinniadriaticum]MCX2930690.1 MlaD family protein [Mycobacterium pinniadriaticum]MCX2937114.1 MlaD family protein [Mycobacterium pinniadriaticum]
MKATVWRDSRLWGTAALAIMTILAVVAAAVYISPPGSKVVSFYTDDASSIQPGITVRIAGITVGKVTDLSIEPKQVRVNATVEGSAFVGDQSSVEVRMLTVVGGYYVNLDSLGDKPLGKSAIPKGRVTLPYSLVRTLTDATKITDGLAPVPIKQSLDNIQHGLSGSNLDTITAIVDAGTAMTDMLARQRGELSQILNMSDEYIEQLAQYRGRLEELIEKVAILEQTLVLYGKGFAAAMQGMGKILLGIGPVADFYMAHREEFLEKFTRWQQIVRTWADRNGLVIRILKRTRQRLYQALDRQNAPPELLATDVCIPVPGSPC